jgi:monofunctional biosynthetic peptidoglycan transglycosylase
LVNKSRKSAKKAKRGKTLRIFTILLVLLAALLLTPVALVAIYRVFPPPVTPLMVMRLFEGEGLKKDWVPLSEISPRLVRAVIALEDTKFCQHDGVDWGSMFEALSEHFKGGRLRGASTISMQTTKNLLLWPGRDYIRKGLEVPLTFWMELLWDKRRIIEVYLNIAEWGPGIYGAEAAAQKYFGKSVSRLTNWEAARMAAVLPNPRRWSPSRPTAYIRGRAYTALARNGEIGTLRCTHPARRARRR